MTLERILGWTGLALLWLLTLAASSASPVWAQTLRPYVFFIVVDTARADHCSYAGYQRDTTPTLDLLAQGFTVFTNAERPASYTPLLHLHAFRPARLQPRFQLPPRRPTHRHGGHALQ